LKYCVILKNAVLGLKRTGIYPYKPNVISETAFGPSCISDQPAEQGPSTPVCSNPQQNKDIITVQSIGKHIISIIIQSVHERLPTEKMTRI
jgi:hypothetical protein